MEQLIGETLGGITALVIMAYGLKHSWSWWRIIVLALVGCLIVGLALIAVWH